MSNTLTHPRVRIRLSVSIKLFFQPGFNKQVIGYNGNQTINLIAKSFIGNWQRYPHNLMCFKCCVFFFGLVLFLLLLEAWNKVKSVLSNMAFSFLFHDLVFWYNKWAGHNIWDTMCNSTIHSWRLLKFASLMGKCENMKILFESPLTLKIINCSNWSFLDEPIQLAIVKSLLKKRINNHGSTNVCFALSLFVEPLQIDSNVSIHTLFKPNQTIPLHDHWCITTFLYFWKVGLSNIGRTVYQLAVQLIRSCLFLCVFLQITLYVPIRPRRLESTASYWSTVSLTPASQAGLLWNFADDPWWMFGVWGPAYLILPVDSNRFEQIETFNMKK